MSKDIMEEYSTTFFECVLEYPEDVQEDIFNLYAYLRVVDEMVEQPTASAEPLQYSNIDITVCSFLITSVNID